MKRAAPALAAAAAWALFAVLAVAIWRQLPAVYPLDGEVDQALARAFLAGDNPYTPGSIARYHLGHWAGVGHPPTTGLWFVPLAAVPLDRLNQALGAVMLALLAAHLLLLCRALRFPFASAGAGLLAALILRQEWFVQHLAIAQISLLIAFLILVAWLALRGQRDRTAGVALGLACTLKLFPGVLALYLLVTGRRRAFLAALATYSTFALVVTARFGPSSWWLFFTQQAPLAREWIGKSYNGSLEGILLRLAHPGAADAPLDGWVPVVYPLLAVALLGATLWWVRRASELDLSYVLVACVGVFLNPWAWPHYHALLILPVLVLAAALVRGWRTSPMQIAAATALALAVVIPAAAWPAAIAAAALLLRQSTSLPKKLTSLPR